MQLLSLRFFSKLDNSTVSISLDIHPINLPQALNVYHWVPQTWWRHTQNVDKVGKHVSLERKLVEVPSYALPVSSTLCDTEENMASSTQLARKPFAKWSVCGIAVECLPWQTVRRQALHMVRTIYFPGKSYQIEQKRISRLTHLFWCVEQPAPIARCSAPTAGHVSDFGRRRIVSSAQRRIIQVVWSRTQTHSVQSRRVVVFENFPSRNGSRTPKQKFCSKQYSCKFFARLSGNFWFHWKRGNCQNSCVTLIQPTKHPGGRLQLSQELWQKAISVWTLRSRKQERQARMTPPLKGSGSWGKPRDWDDYRYFCWPVGATFTQKERANNRNYTVTTNAFWFSTKELWVQRSDSCTQGPPRGRLTGFLAQRFHWRCLFESEANSEFVFSTPSAACTAEKIIVRSHGNTRNRKLQMIDDLVQSAIRRMPLYCGSHASFHSPVCSCITWCGTQEKFVLLYRMYTDCFSYDGRWVSHHVRVTVAICFTFTLCGSKESNCTQNHTGAKSIYSTINAENSAKLAVPSKTGRTGLFVFAFCSKVFFSAKSWSNAKDDTQESNKLPTREKSASVAFNVVHNSDDAVVL